MIASGALANLKELYLQRNKVGDEGMQAFASAIATGALANLETLYLHQNEISDPGMAAFADAIATGAPLAISSKSEHCSFSVLFHDNYTLLVRSLHDSCATHTQHRANICHNPDHSA